MKIYKLGFIGAGNMAQGIIKGVGGQSFKIVASSPDEEHLSAVKALGVDVSTDNNYVAANSQYLVLAVKPDIAQQVIKQIAPYITSDTVIISIMAGVTIDTLLGLMPEVKQAARVMPNMAAVIKQSAGGIAYRNCGDEVKEFIGGIFGKIGKFIETDEDRLSAVTALSGSGTAYVYYFMDAVIEQATELGLDYQSAKLLAVQTFRGAAEMADKSDRPLKDMIGEVCSKGGTTIRAIETFDREGVFEAVKKGVKACYLRAVELSETGKQ